MEASFMAWRSESMNLNESTKLENIFRMDRGEGGVGGGAWPHHFLSKFLNN